MTAVVGVLCTDGIVIGTDGSVTFAQGPHPTIEQPTEKLYVGPNNVIVAATGAAGHAQRFFSVSDRVFESIKEPLPPYLEVGKHLARHALDDFSFTHSNAEHFGALVGFPLGSECFLCEFSDGNFQPEFKDSGIWYVSMGSGQHITDPFLALMRDIFWKDDPPSLQDGKFAVTWALSHVIDVNPGGINYPIQISVLERAKDSSPQFKARFIDNAELQEHHKNIDEAKKHLRQYVSDQQHSPEDLQIPKPDEL